jgi:hypothetical protein
MIVITYFSGNNNGTITEHDKDKINTIKLTVEAFIGLFLIFIFFLKFCSIVSDKKNEVANHDVNSLSS